MSILIIFKRHFILKKKKIALLSTFYFYYLYQFVFFLGGLFAYTTVFSLAA
jgi:hypothetical protein